MDKVEDKVEDKVGALKKSSSMISEKQLSTIVEEVVERKIAPLRSMLAEQNLSGPGLTEIIGGLGWIVGIFGAAALGRASQKRKES
jgi:nickel transport protein